MLIIISGISNFLSSLFLRKVEAFDLQYLSRVVDVKDTVHKAPLMLHLVELVVDKFPESTDLYSELSHVHRLAKVSHHQLSVSQSISCTSLF